MTKAHFVYEFNGIIQGLFENEYKAEQTLLRTKLAHVNTIEYLKRVIVASDLNLFKKNNPISLDFDSLYDVFPEQINTKQINQRIEFKLKSKSIELMDMKKEVIIFLDHDKSIVNMEIPDNYKLYKD